jgi:hypothetical protein
MRVKTIAGDTRRHEVKTVRRDKDISAARTRCGAIIIGRVTRRQQREVDCINCQRARGE